MSESLNASRRDFLKTSSVALSAGLLLNSAIATRAYAAGNDTIRVGLVGAGGRGSGAAAQALSTEGPVKLVAIADAFEDSLEGGLRGITRSLGDRAKDRIAVDQEHKFVGLDAFEKLVALKDIDLVILATPPGFRPMQVEAAIKAGKNVFMEKPVASDAPGVRKVLEACKLAKEKGLKIGVGLQRHHQAPYLETIKRIHDGEIGDVIAQRVYWNGGGVWDPRKTREQCKSEMEYQIRNWYYYTWLSGDHIDEQHIHNLDVGCWVKNAYPVECHGIGGRQVRTDKKYGEIYDHFACEYTFADGSKMFSQCQHIANCWSSVSEAAHGTKGTANVSGSSIDAGGNKWKFNGKSKDPYQVEHDDLFAAIRNNTPYSEGENGAYSTLTAIMGRMAVYSGKNVTWEQALNSKLDLLPETLTWDALPKTLPNAEGVYPVAVPGLSRAF